MRKNKKYPLGGLLTAAQLIEPILQEKLEQITAAPVVPDMTYNASPYGKMKKGGILPNEFTQYSAPDHAQGGQTVDANGNPSTTKPVAEIQNNENTFKNYVYSDELTNPKTGNKFNIDMQKLVKKYKGSDMDMIKKAGLNVEAENLSKTNDVVRSVSEAIDSAMPQAPNGIDLEPLPQLPYKVTPGMVGQAGNENLPHISDPFSFGDGAYDISVPTVPDPWFGITPQESLKREEVSYGTRPKSIAEFVKATLTKSPNKTYDDTPYSFDNAETTPRGNPTDVSPVFDDKSGITGGATPEKKPFNYNIPALVAKGLGFAGSVANALKPAQKERLILPDYQDADNSFNRASIDYTSAEQDALGVSNYLSNMNRGTSSGFQQFRNREQARIADLQDKLSGINMAERNTNSQLDVTRGQYRAGKAQDIANRTYQNQVDNLQNEAAKQQFNDQMFSELTQIGSSFNQYQGFREELANRKDIADMNMKEFSALAKARGLNFTVGEAEEFLQSIKEGKSPISFRK